MAKKNNGIKTYIAIAGIVLTVLLLIVGFVKGYTKLEGKVDTVEGNVKHIKDIDLLNIEGDIDYHDDRLYEQEKEVFGVKKEIRFLGEKVDNTLTIQQEILVEIKKLHD